MTDLLVTRHYNRVTAYERQAAKHLHPKRSWWYHTAEYNKPKLYQPWGYNPRGWVG